ncbi:BMC_2a_G0041160.mRNA.1.CDS.1 [Saccharomyces cerevisiae]|nr:BMC_2a_G0041160.mRNA.1.CDS.1 [Saccharomyces cerevisiae]CAI4581638.1 BMB_G0041150.mRNA.1.CDS.1 [Saccharomyces cerevisiae]CAI7196256.1 BMC_2a_G0041160.mRNA.1.CDS.1 [Saccharomyces cerevisiae]CAI7198455.1 BMB_G0041150.mRNA.1.CDS.1 [Saccharomyces cerevisiae]
MPKAKKPSESSLNSSESVVDTKTTLAAHFQFVVILYAARLAKLFVELFLAYNKQRLYFRSSPLLTAEFLRLTNEMQERTKSGAAPNARVLIGQALGAETRCALQFPHDKAKTVSFPRIIHTSITNPWIKLSLVRPYYTFLFSCMLYKIDP